MIRIMLVDDHALVRMGIKNLLTDVSGKLRALPIEIIAEASSGEEAIELAQLECPDIVLMDIKMPGIGGLEATIRLLQKYPKIKIIAVTACDEDPFPSRMLQAGAVGYITKTCEQNNLIAAVEMVYRGGRYIMPQLVQQLALGHLSEDSESPFNVLSERELQVMFMITNGIRVQDISTKLNLSSKTVNTYRYRIFEKLKINSDVELTHIALRYKISEKNKVMEEATTE